MITAFQLTLNGQKKGMIYLARNLHILPVSEMSSCTKYWRKFQYHNVCKYESAFFKDLINSKMPLLGLPWWRSG